MQERNTTKKLIDCKDGGIMTHEEQRKLRELKKVKQYESIVRKKYNLQIPVRSIDK